MSVLVYTENWDGRFKKLSFELVTFASRLAGMTGGSVTALSIGKVDGDQLEILGRYGASVILSADGVPSGLDNQLYTSIITAAVKNTGANIVVLANNNAGKAIAPRLSVRLKAGLAPGVAALPESVNPLVISRRVFSGKALARLRITSPLAILTLMQNSVDPAETGSKPEIRPFDPEVNPAEARTRVKNVQKQEGKLLLNDAEIVVSGGRGMRSPDNWGPLEELARVLGAATACSRPVSDEGWRPHDEHTGQTGKIIAPNLYMAFGISGAIQHLAGVSASRCIVAVNTDKDAPIFQAADYGIVGDALKILPELVAEIKAARAS